MPRETRNPSNASTFDRAAIEASGRRDLGELLQTTPGVVVTQAGGPGSGDAHFDPRLGRERSARAASTAFRSTRAITGDADLSRISLETVERVTVLTGAQSARYGAARNGRRHRDRDAPRDRRAIAAAAHGRVGRARDLPARRAAPRPPGARRLGGSITGDYRYVRGDFPYDLPAVRGGGTATRINSDVSAGQLLGSASLEDSIGVERVRASWEDLSRGLAGSIVQPSTSGRESNTRVSGGADVRRALGPVTWTALADLSHERATFADPAPPFGPPYDDTVRATALDATTTATLGDAASSAMLGGEVRTLDVAATLLAPGAPHCQRLLGAFGSYHFSRFLTSSRIVVAAEASARVDNSSLDDHTAFSPRVGASVSRACGPCRHLSAMAIRRRRSPISSFTRACSCAPIPRCGPSAREPMSRGA